MSGVDREAGVTLLEMLVVLALMSLVAASVARAPLGVRDGALLRREATALEATLADARRAALAEGRAVTVRLDPRAGCYGRENEPCRPLPADAALSVRAVAGLSAPDAAGVRFHPDGSATGAEVVLTLGERRCTLTVPWTTGRVIAS